MSTPAASAERLAALPSLTTLGPGDVDPATVPHRRLPAWLKRPIPASGGMGATAKLIEDLVAKGQNFSSLNGAE